MGEANRRRGLSLPPRTVRCPVLTCRHRHVTICPRTGDLSQMLARMWGGVAPTDHYQCNRCGVLWEALPGGWSDDSVERATTMGLCDNCAFRASSPETRDPDKRAWLHAKAETGDPYAAIMSPFCCHKGVPLKITRDPPSIEYDFAAAGINPADRTCSGFLRLLWARNGVNDERRQRAAGAAPTIEPET